MSTERRYILIWDSKSEYSFPMIIGSKDDVIKYLVDRSISGAIYNNTAFSESNISQYYISNFILSDDTYHVLNKFYENRSIDDASYGYAIYDIDIYSPM